MRRAALTAVAVALGALDAACGSGNAAPAAPVPHYSFSAAGSDYFTIGVDGGAPRPTFLKGVNLGRGVPGAEVNDFAITSDQYSRWLDAMGELGINVLRVYSLHLPKFYDALAAHNRAHPDKTVFLMHGIWLDGPDETSTQTLDLYTNTESFHASIEETIDALHGNRSIPMRHGKAYGNFTTDVSPWLIGFLVGRETLPQEVLATDMIHPADVAFEGQKLAIHGVNPSSAWIVSGLDYTLTYEANAYAGATRPVGYSNWLPTDPLHHPTENARTLQDVATIDTSKVELVDAPAGVFASFHVYPYNPLFMCEDPGYQAYWHDELGSDGYRGYLHDLKGYHGKMPVVVAEFGVPSSYGNAKYTSNGMSHGGHDEQMQAAYTRRMVRDIQGEKLAGAIYFAWQDEWYKDVWYTLNLATPPDRFKLWHDFMNPQEFYGLLAFDPTPPDFSRLSPATAGAAGRIQEVRAAVNPEFFSVRIQLTSPLAPSETLTVGYDTYGDAVGESILPDGSTGNRRYEFALTVSPPGTAQLKVLRAYDLNLYNQGGHQPWSKLRSVKSDARDWLDMVRTNQFAHQSTDGTFKFPELEQPIGQLRVEAGTPTTLDHVTVGDDGSVTIRIPWGLLQFTDPTTRSVMNGDVAYTTVETATSDGVAVGVAIGGELFETPRFAWDPWNSAPDTTERFKAAASALKEAYAATPDPAM